MLHSKGADASKTLYPVIEMIYGVQSLTEKMKN